MSVIFVLLLLAALVLFLLATAGVPSRLNFIALGLACWVLVPLIHALQSMH